MTAADRDEEYYAQFRPDVLCAALPPDALLLLRSIVKNILQQTVLGEGHIEDNVDAVLALIDRGLVSILLDGDAYGYRLNIPPWYR